MQVLEREEKREEESGVDRMARRTPMTAGDPVATVAAGSVLLAWYQFYVKGDKQSGIFIGLWAPTMLAAASYLQQKDVIGKVKRGMQSF